MRDLLLNKFALSCFRDVADADYIAARMCYRADLIGQALWSSQQTIEKYIKCLLLLRRIQWKKPTHWLLKPLAALEKQYPMQLSPEVRTFIGYLDAYGPDRYFTFPYAIEGREILKLDQAVWEIRRYCFPYRPGETHNGTLIDDLHIKHVEDAVNRSPQRYQPVSSGFLERILKHPDHDAHGNLIWKNLYFGHSRRKSLRSFRMKRSVANSPLALYPEIFDDLSKYVFLPDGARDMK